MEINTQKENSLLVMLIEKNQIIEALGRKLTEMQAELKKCQEGKCQDTEKDKNPEDESK